MLIYDDVKIEFFNGPNQDKIFHFWFHTSFIDSNGILFINKYMTENAHKDKKCLKYDKNFQVKVQLSKIDPGNYKMVEKLLPKMPRKVKKSKEKPKSKSKSKSKEKKEKSPAKKKGKEKAREKEKKDKKKRSQSVENKSEAESGTEQDSKKMASSGGETDFDLTDPEEVENPADLNQKVKLKVPIEDLKPNQIKMLKIAEKLKAP